MLNKKLLNKEIQEYIKYNINSDLSSVRLKKSPFEGVTSLELAQQIQGKKIARLKFPFLHENEEIIYPPHLNLEQASSQLTAEFKRNLVSGKKGIDLTGGTGIDSFFLSLGMDEFYYVEPNLELLEIVQHNYSVLSKNTVYFINDTAENFLENNTESFDFLYLDPSRRDKNKNKKFLLEDLVPNVIDLQEKLVKISKTVFIKLSPLLDIQQAIEQLNIEEFYIISLKNEVKELIVKLSTGKIENPKINCVNLESNQPDFSFHWLEEKNAEIPNYSSIQEYLYIPNTSILKSGAFKLIANKYKLNKLHPNTHVYTSREIINNFPGRIFNVIEPDFNPKNSKNKVFNLISKNYPLKVEEIKKKYKLTEGGKEYLFFIKDIDKNSCVLAGFIS